MPDPNTCPKCGGFISIFGAWLEKWGLPNSHRCPDTIVLRVTNPKQVVTMNPHLEFRREQHGDGPVHYSAMIEDDLVLELYPPKKKD